jgi:prophage antirepressor-like protein
MSKSKKVNNNSLITKVELFKDNQVRRVKVKGTWFFNLADIVVALTGTTDVRSYIAKMKKRDTELYVKWGTICTRVDMLASDGKVRKTNAVDLENAFRIIQSIPSKKAEPFKRWLAKVGVERLKEEANPALAVERAVKAYKKQGKTSAWIKDRLQSVETRNRLTELWSNCSVKDEEYAKLTNITYKGAFGMKAKELKQLKGIKNKLRNHMTRMELAMVNIAEETTIDVTLNNEATNLTEAKQSAMQASYIVREMAEVYEKRMGRPIASSENGLGLKLF